MAPNQETVPERVRPRTSPTLIPRAALWLRLFGVSTRADDVRLAALRAATLQSDPLADALVDAMAAAPAGQGRRQFEAALEHGSACVEHAPPALVQLFAQVETTPAWLDRVQLKRGAEAMLRQGAEGLCALSAVSLMGGYLSSNATKPLAQTGALLNMAPRRLAETTQFVWAVASSGALERDTAGFKACLRVRVMHAFVRRQLSAAPTWRRELWGVPINQRDMVATHLSFTLMFVLGVSALGRIVTTDERDAIVHLWRYVSFLLGTPDVLLPKTFRETAELGALFNISEPGPDADGRLLARALMSAWGVDAPRIGGRPDAGLFGSFMQGYARFVLGGQAADRLGIPDTWWQHLPPVLALLRLSSELYTLHVSGRGVEHIEAGRRIIERQLHATLHGAPARYVARNETAA